MSSIKINMYVCFEIDHFVFSEDLTRNCYLSFVNIKNRVAFLQSLCYNGLILRMTKILIFLQQISWRSLLNRYYTWNFFRCHMKSPLCQNKSAHVIFLFNKNVKILNQKNKNQIEDFVWNYLFKNKAYFSRNLMLVYFEILV